MDPQVPVGYFAGDCSVVSIEERPPAESFDVILFIRPEGLPQALFRLFSEHVGMLSAPFQRRMRNVNGGFFHARR